MNFWDYLFILNMLMFCLIIYLALVPRRIRTPRKRNR